MFLERWAVVLSSDVCISLDECHDFTNMRWLMFLEIRVCGFLSNVNYHYDDCTMKMWNYGYSRKQEFVLSSNCFCTFKSETKIKVYLLNPMIKMQIFRVTIHPVLYFPVSRVSKKISFKDDMECIAILRDSWMIHDTFWRKQISRTSYFGMKSDANKEGSVMKCITLKLLSWRSFVFSWEFIRFLCIGQLFICTLNNKNFT